MESSFGVLDGNWLCRRRWREGRRVTDHRPATPWLGLEDLCYRGIIVDAGMLEAQRRVVGFMREAVAFEWDGVG